MYPHPPVGGGGAGALRRAASLEVPAVIGRQLPSPTSALLAAAVALAAGSGRADVLAPGPSAAEGAPAALERPARAEGEPAFRLSIPGRAVPDLSARPEGTLVAAASAPAGKGDDASSLDFDLLGAPKVAPLPREDPSLRTRRRMLTWHQGLGIGLYGLQLASTVTGQLNYDDKFGVANTGRYKATHRVITYLDLGMFATVGAIALFAPRDRTAPPRGFGRTTVHKVFMALATAGMITQGYLGVRTAQREGYLDQQSYGRAHLVVGYATLAAMSVAVGAIVF